MHAAASRLLEQWSALVRYMLVYIPKHRPKLTATSKYLKIVNALKKPTAKAEVQFVVNSAEVFQRFTLKFQRQEPLIHVLYDELRDLLLTLVGRTCKAEVHKDFDKTENPFDEENLIAPANIAVGDDMKYTRFKCPG